MKKSLLALVAALALSAGFAQAQTTVTKVERHGPVVVQKTRVVKHHPVRHHRHHMHRHHAPKRVIVVKH